MPGSFSPAADPAVMHLEKMGRELKCPICLSLLNQAASLSCNHIFCNACILKSMKSSADCPVCKVPFSRREVRPALHMDNLVHIYRSMEMASGISLFVSQPAATLDSSEDKGKKKSPSCPNDLKRKLSVLPRGRRKRAKEFGACNSGKKPTGRRGTSSDGATGHLNANNSEQRTPDQPIPSPHQPVKHSFPTKKRVQVSLYPPGSALETPLRAMKRNSNSGHKIPQCEFDGNDDGLALGNHDNLHSNSNIQMGLDSEAKADPAASSKMKRVPSPADKFLLDDLGNPVLAPFFWLRDHDSEENEGGQLPTPQLTQTTQITQTTPPKCPSFSDLKDSDEEGFDQELQSEQANNGITVPDTFDSEMFEWTQRPCSPELTCSPAKQQSPKSSLVLELPAKDLQEDGALLHNGLEESDSVTNPHPYAQCSKKEDAFEDMFVSPNGCTAAEVPDTYISEKRQALNTACNDNLANAHIETENVAEKSYWNKKAELKIDNKEACFEGKEHTRGRPKSTGGIQRKIFCKRKTQAKSNKASDSSTIEKFLSPPSDPVVGCGDNEKSPQDSSKEQFITADDIFKAIFSTHADDLAAHNTAVESTGAGVGIQEQKHQMPVNLRKSTQNEFPSHSADYQTPKHQPVESVIKGSGLLATTQVDVPEVQLPVLGSCRSGPSPAKGEIICVFCRSSGDSEAAGQMMHYSNGKPVSEQEEMPSNVIHVHKLCAEWAPDVYFTDDSVMNLEAEVARAIKIKCSCCGVRGAALGCCVKRCRKSFHIPCALSIPECRWDVDNFVMLCPAHALRKFPNERKKSPTNRNQGRKEERLANDGIPCRGAKSPAGRQLVAAGSKSAQPWTRPSGQACKWVLCGSALDISAKEQLVEFASLTGAMISKTWSPSVTHVIASTDVNGACRRTLKFLMAILEGKWVVKTDWIVECTKAGHPVEEGPFEITHDIHGTSEGPKRGRARVEKKEPKLFEGLNFYFSGEFSASSKGYLQDLASAAGGVILHRKPIMDQPEGLSEVKLSTIVLYNVEISGKAKSIDREETVQQRFMEAKSLADATGSQVAAHTWLLESIAACQLQPTCKNCI